MQIKYAHAFLSRDSDPSHFTWRVQIFLKTEKLGLTDLSVCSPIDLLTACQCHTEGLKNGIYSSPVIATDIKREKQGKCIDQKQAQLIPFIVILYVKGGTSQRAGCLVFSVRLSWLIKSHVSRLLASLFRGNMAKQEI